MIGDQGRQDQPQPGQGRQGQGRRGQGRLGAPRVAPGLVSGAGKARIKPWVWFVAALVSLGLWGVIFQVL